MSKPRLIAVAARRLGAAGRKSGHSTSIASDAAPTGYLFVPCVCTHYNGHSTCTICWVQAVPIVRKTAKLIYYTSDSWNWRKAVVSPGCISRPQFEADTRGQGGEPSRHGYPAGVIPIPPGGRQSGSAGRLFFASREAAEGHLDREERRQAGEADAREAALIKELRRAMAKAHPDHGGTAQQFIEARSRYPTGVIGTREGDFMNETCDRCGPAVSAAYRADHGGELCLCGHCTNMLRAALTARGWRIRLIHEQPIEVPVT
jgi:hypothetical protein